MARFGASACGSALWIRQAIVLIVLNESAPSFGLELRHGDAPRGGPVLAIRELPERGESRSDVAQSDPVVEPGCLWREMQRAVVLEQLHHGRMLGAGVRRDGRDEPQHLAALLGRERSPGVGIAQPHSTARRRYTPRAPRR